MAEYLGKITLINVIDGAPGTPGAPGQDGTSGKDGEDGLTFYTWIKYADDENGNNMSDSPVDKKYMGIAYNKETHISKMSRSEAHNRKAKCCFGTCRCNNVLLFIG